ncbi:MAG: hypothetical protein AVDCRST_MAG73-1542, partial [uncultured Thermomicrobiales bacterium]
WGIARDHGNRATASRGPAPHGQDAFLGTPVSAAVHGAAPRATPGRRAD